MGIEENEGISKRISSQEKLSLLSARRIFTIKSSTVSQQTREDKIEPKFFIYSVADLSFFAAGNTRLIGNRSI